MPKQKKDTDERPGGPFSIPDVTDNEDDMSTSRRSDESTSGNDDVGKGRSDKKSAEASKLRQHLELVVDDPVPMLMEKPDLASKPNGYVSEEVDEMLRGVVNVLETRYGKDFSKSLVMDYALRAVLLDARKEAEESQLVRWLDTVLDRKD